MAGKRKNRIFVTYERNNKRNINHGRCSSVLRSYALRHDNKIKKKNGYIINYSSNSIHNRFCGSNKRIRKMIELIIITLAGGFGFILGLYITLKIGGIL